MNSKSGMGFTVTELLVVISILVILSTLVVARLSNSQGGARDHEREIDTSSIATGLELYYQNGSPVAGIPKGYYPGAQQVQAAAAASSPFSEFLDSVPKSSFEAPGRSITDSFGVNPAYATAPPGSNSDGSYSDSQARALLSTFPYLYQPLTRGNTFCANYSDCVKFNLYYLNEGTDTVVTIRSKHQ